MTTAAPEPAPAPTSRARRWSSLYERGRARRGPVHVTDADAVELSRRSYHRRVYGEVWERLPGTDVVLLPGASLEDPRVLASAVQLWLGDRAVLSHGTAAWVHGLLPNPPSTVHVTVPADRAPQPADDTPVRVARSRTLLASEVVEVEGLRVTRTDRTLRDLGAVVDDRRMLDLLTVAEQRELVDLATLRAQAERPGTAAGTARFRRMVDVRTRDRSDSGLERDTAALCRRHGFVPHDGPYPLRCPDGRTVHLDVAFPDLRFAIECDGVAFHRDADAVRIDRLRWRQIQAAGWTITWVTRADLLRAPEEILAVVRDAHQGVRGAAG